MKDWFVDGHTISAATAAEAARECERIYGHVPEIVREWTPSDG